MPPTHGVKEGLPNPHRDRSGLAIADVAPIDSRDGGDLDPRTAEERFVSDVELGAIDVALFDRNALIAGKLQHRAPRDAFQNIAGDRRGNEGAVANEEEVASAPFRDVTL